MGIHSSLNHKLPLWFLDGVGFGFEKAKGVHNCSWIWCYLAPFFLHAYTYTHLFCFPCQDSSTCQILQQSKYQNCFSNEFSVVSFSAAPSFHPIPRSGCQRLTLLCSTWGYICGSEFTKGCSGSYFVPSSEKVRKEYSNGLEFYLGF